MSQLTRISSHGSKKHDETKSYDHVLCETINLIKKEFDNVDKVNEHSSLTNDLDLDSVEVMELIEIFEDRFGIEIPIEDLPELQTIEDLVRLIYPLIQDKQK